MSLTAEASVFVTEYKERVLSTVAVCPKCAEHLELYDISDELARRSMGLLTCGNRKCVASQIVLFVDTNTYQIVHMIEKAR